MPEVLLHTLSLLLASCVRASASSSVSCGDNNMDLIVGLIMHMCAHVYTYIYVCVRVCVCVCIVNVKNIIDAQQTFNFINHSPYYTSPGSQIMKPSKAGQNQNIFKISE